MILQSSLALLFGDPVHEENNGDNDDNDQDRQQPQQ
jgi:hypothetical protein